MSAAIESPTAPSVPRRSDSALPFRADLDGLRAVAILLVVGYHIGLGGFGAGFVGVDVFFVLSGFLITRNLLRDLDDGSVSLTRFWAKRVRRLMPALTLVTVVTIVASMLALTPFDWSRTAQDGLASLLYVSNITFAQQSLNYFAGGVERSPFLHTWSLSLEEQFYLVWPLAFAVLARAVRTPTARRMVLAAVFTLSSAASLLLAVRLTARGTPWSFFSLPTRAWEFGLAGLLAVVAHSPRFASNARLASAASVTGCLLLAASMVVMDGSSRHPGLVTLLPVVGTLLLIAGGSLHRESFLRRPLSLEPLQWLGRLSYSWYLWHWPAIVLVADKTDSLAWRCAAAGVALVLAQLTYSFVENRVRYSAVLVRSRTKTFSVAALLVVVGGSVTIAAREAGDRRMEQPFYARLLAAKSDTPWNEIAASCIAERIAGVDACRFGPAGRPAVLVLGDSHALQWSLILAELLENRGFSTVVRTRGNCPPSDVPVAIGSTRRTESPGCASFKRQNPALLDALDPVAVIVASASYGSRILGASDDEERGRIWEAGHRRLLSQLGAHGRPVGLILDNPRLRSDPIRCIVEAGTPSVCELTREEAERSVAPTRRAELRAALATPGVTVLDALDLVCDQRSCPLVLESGALVYSDDNHLSVSAMRNASARVERFLDDVVEAK